LCLNGEGWMVIRIYLGTGPVEVFDAELSAIGVALQKSVESVEAL